LHGRKRHFGIPAAADHEVIGIVDDVGIQPLIVCGCKKTTPQFL
jgi:hypothetical protein